MARANHREAPRNATARPEAEPPLAHAAFALYRFAGAAAAPLVRRALRRRAAAGREDPARLQERLGRAGLARPPGALVWLHGASLGEALSALPLTEHIRRAWPDLTVLVTTGTVTSARLMAERLPAGALHQYAPVDLPAAVDSFLEHWRPGLGLLIESELWPNLLRAAHGRGIPLMLVNGRMSPRSYAGWRRARPLSAGLLGLFAQVFAQSEADAARLRALGARRVRCLGNLKLAAPPLGVDEADLVGLRAALGARPCWLAASTHPGEEAVVARAHRAAAAICPGLLTLIAPRHPERGPEIAAALRAAGERVARRGAGEPLAPETGLYVADTIGELGLWYRLAPVVFVGGSLVPKGGQNLLEPARLGCAILCGPHTENFREIAQGLERAGALQRVADAEALAAALARLLRDAPARAGMAQAGRDYAGAQGQVIDAVIEALAPSLDALAGRG